MALTSVERRRSPAGIGSPSVAHSVARLIAAINPGDDGKHASRPRHRYSVGSLQNKNLIREFFMPSPCQTSRRSHYTTHYNAIQYNLLKAATNVHAEIDL